jgi:shikimate kinase
MNLIFLYGPPAVGKLTVATELSKILDLPLVDLHSILNPLARVFGWRHPERCRLGDLFRFELFAAAAREQISMITTFGGGGACYDPFIQKVKQIVEAEGGTVIFVRLTAPKEVILERAENQSRVEQSKISDREKLAEHIEKTPDVFERARVPEHLEVDTSKQSPEESAQIIAEALKDRLDACAQVMTCPR